MSYFQYLFSTLIVPILIIISGSIIFYHWSKKSMALENEKIKKIKNKFLFLMIFFKRRAVAYLVLLISVFIFFYGLALPDFIRQNFGDDYFSKFYINPKKAKFFSPVKKKNLILIYVESLETNLVNKKLYGQNLISSITELQGQEVPFFIFAPGTEWSIAGMVSTMCALPLKPVHRFNLEGIKNFLTSATCLSDVLSKHGYEQYFLVGIDKKFDEMEKFFSQHHYQYIFGREDWIQKGIDKALLTSWGGGVHDDVLFDEAYKIIKGYSHSNKPFNITIKTSDSHAPEGTPSERCLPEEKVNGFRGSFTCTSREVKKFILNLKNEKLLENTEVVILGDHLFMNSIEKIDLFPHPRYIYIKFILDSNLKLTTNQMTNFDVAPSILDALEFKSSLNSKMGLGLSVFKETTKLVRQQHLDEVTDPKIQYQSLSYKALWLPKFKFRFGITPSLY